MRRGPGRTPVRAASGSSPPSVAELLASLRRAVARRPAGLRGERCALRWFHDSADGIPGLVIEQWGPGLVVQAHEERLRVPLDRLRPACEALSSDLGARAVYLKTFPRDRSGALPRLEQELRSATPWIGSPLDPEFEIEENGLRFRIRPYDGYSVGLFLEQRANRARVRSASAGRAILNLFAYTCGFGVAAAAGGARQTVNVDVSKRYLEWGKGNYEANGQTLERTAATFLASDAFEALARLGRQQRRFEGAILDPPVFGRAGRGARPFAIEQDLARLVSQTVDLLEERSWLLVCCNQRSLSGERLRAAITAGLGNRNLGDMTALPLPPDFAGDPDFARCFWVGPPIAGLPG